MSACRFAPLALAALLLIGCERKQPLQFLPTAPQDRLSQTYWTVPDFALTERSGETVDLASLKGKVWLADFFYTTCPGPCPMLSSRLSEIAQKIGSDDRVRLVSISTDPEKDTPAVLKLYAEKFKAGPRWLFLTGRKGEIYDLATKGFKLPIAEDRTAPEPVTHSTRLILIDQSGTIRGFYEGVGDESSEHIVRDLRRLLEATP